MGLANPKSFIKKLFQKFALLVFLALPLLVGQKGEELKEPDCSLL